MEAFRQGVPRGRNEGCSWRLAGLCQGSVGTVKEAVVGDKVWPGGPWKSLGGLDEGPDGMWG